MYFRIVDSAGRPCLVANSASDDARAIHFQASAQGVTDQSFGLNHPKNYLGYPLAMYADGDTSDLLEQYDVIGATDDARRGSAFLGLTEETAAGPRLTPLGDEVIRFALDHSGSVKDALAEFADWYRSRKRFTDLAPAWGQLARRVVWAYPATPLLVEGLQTLHDDGGFPALARRISRASSPLTPDFRRRTVPSGNRGRSNAGAQSRRCVP